jgi:ribonuclease VapC
VVIDTSAVMAVLFDEPDADAYEAAIASAEHALMSTGTVLECAIVLAARHGPAGPPKLDALLHEQGVEVVPFDPAQLALARAAHQRFGRGRHVAALNFGDCFAYALAKARGLPVLFKGADFAHTDVGSAL